MTIEKDSAIAAGYSVAGAAVAADKLMLNPAIRTAIKAASKDQASAAPFDKPGMPRDRYDDPMAFLQDLMNHDGLPLAMRAGAAEHFRSGGHNAAGGYTVPKFELVNRVQALLHTGLLHMPDETATPLAKVFRRVLLDFRATYTPVGNATFGAREGAHDDLILAVALAAWGLTRQQVGVWR